MVDDEQKERERKALSRQRTLALRAREIAFWMQRDTKKVAYLKKRWAEQDALRESRKLFDYICTTCNRPFTNPRKLPPQNPGRCYVCTAYHRKQKQREYYARHPEQFRKKPKAPSAPKPVPIEGQSESLAYRGPREPQVVWQVDG